MKYHVYVYRARGEELAQARHVEYEAGGDHLCGGYVEIRPIDPSKKIKRSEGE